MSRKPFDYSIQPEISINGRRPRALDLFCKAGGISAGLYEAGFEVTGVDIEPQPRYPFTFIRANALDVDLEGYDLITASPPCQLHTRLKKFVTREYLDLIEPVRDRLDQTGACYIIENVPGAPLIKPIMLCGTMFGLRVIRHRLFESNLPLIAPPHPKHNGSANSHRRRAATPAGEYVTITGHDFIVAEARAAMQTHWMNQRELAEAIPPAYSRYLATQALDYILTGSAARGYQPPLFT